MTTKPTSLRDKVAESRATGEAGVVPIRGKTMFELVKDMEPQFRRALPRHIDATRFVRIALTTLRTNPKLLTCTTESVLGGLMQAAQLGVEVDGIRGQGYLIPRRNGRTNTTEASFQLGYKGMIDQAWRGGISVEAHEVCAGDVFSFRYGTNPHVDHVPALAGRGETIAYYAIARFPDDRPEQFLVLGREEMETIRDRFASSKNSKGEIQGPWIEHFDAMSRKTVIRRLLNGLPLPVELAEALAADDIPIDVTDNLALPVIDAEVIDDPDPESEPEETPAETPEPPQDAA